RIAGRDIPANDPLQIRFSGAQHVSKIFSGRCTNVISGRKSAENAARPRLCSNNTHNARFGKLPDSESHRRFDLYHAAGGSHNVASRPLIVILRIEPLQSVSV